VSLLDEGEIGAGGTATVRKMYDPSLRRRVAMKTLAPDLAGNPRAHRDFVQEAEITAQLEHPTSSRSTSWRWSTAARASRCA